MHCICSFKETVRWSYCLSLQSWNSLSWYLIFINSLFPLPLYKFITGILFPFLENSNWRTYSYSYNKIIHEKLIQVGLQPISVAYLCWHFWLPTNMIQPGCLQLGRIMYTQEKLLGTKCLFYLKLKIVTKM